jgi:type II secretory ATPase GspE/PulE/Tfp pilus assembly ATPase PilB-like protein
VTMPATGEVFIGKGREIHVAPEGIALTADGQLLAGDPHRYFAEYESVQTAQAGGPQDGWLRVHFHGDRPAWQVSGMQPEQAQAAEKMINDAAAAVQQRDDPMFRKPLPLERLGQQVAALADPSAPQVAPLLDLLLVQAVLHRASDLHLEPGAEEIKVRLRVDGVLHDVGAIPLGLRERLMGRLKVVGAMITYRTDVPQEGRSTARIEGRNVDARISILPTIHGEKATIRVFDPALAVMPLEELGLAEKDLPLFHELLNRPQGTILLTGPAGAGKTTTMYSALSYIHAERRSLSSICTIEDPVEHDIGVISQTETDPEAGLTFARGLRTILRQDPEVIMVGEIRDLETAAIAIQAGLTGHLILSTVHARSAAGVFARLIDIGVEPFLVASSVTAVLAQRLVRKVCQACSQPAEPKPEVLGDLGLSASDVTGWTLRVGSGCTSCAGTGYAGRTGVFQILPVDAGLRGLIMRGLPVAELEQEVARLGIASLRDAALSRAREGVTSLDEVLRVLGSADADL